MFAKSKYKNQKTVIKNIRFDSKLEGMVYLKILELAKKYPIAFERQPEYELIDGFQVNGSKYRKTVYKGDFNIVINGRIFTIDCKGYSTEVFKLKRKLFAKRYGREIVVIRSVSEFEKWFMEKIKEEGLSLYE